MRRGRKEGRKEEARGVKRAKESKNCILYTRPLKLFIESLCFDFLILYINTNH